MSVERVLISIERVLQSDKKWLFAGTMRLTFVHADLPAGNGLMRPSCGLLSHRLTDMLRRKKSIIQIPKDQYGMCCARAIVVGMAQLMSETPRTPGRKTPWGQQVRRYLKLQVSLAKRVDVSGRDTCQQTVWTARMGKVSGRVGQNFSRGRVQGSLQHHSVLRRWKSQGPSGGLVSGGRALSRHHASASFSGGEVCVSRLFW